MRVKIFGLEPEGEAARKARVAQLYGNTASFKSASFKGQFGARPADYKSAADNAASLENIALAAEAKKRKVNPKGKGKPPITMHG